MINILGGSWGRPESDSRRLDRYGYGPSYRLNNIGFRLAKPTITKSSNTGEDEQPDNPTTHLECT